MNVEIGAEAALFPEKEYISRIFVAVWIWVLTQSIPVQKRFSGKLRETTPSLKNVSRIFWRAKTGMFNFSAERIIAVLCGGSERELQ
jgi:hypothetical protein